MYQSFTILGHNKTALCLFLSFVFSFFRPGLKYKLNWIINGHLNLLLSQVSGQQGAVSAPGGNGRSTAVEFFLFALCAFFRFSFA